MPVKILKSISCGQFTDGLTDRPSYRSVDKLISEFGCIYTRVNVFDKRLFNRYTYIDVSVIS